LGFTAFAAALACSRSSCCQFIVAAPLVDHARAVLTDDATRRISGRLKKILPTNLHCLPAAALRTEEEKEKSAARKRFSSYLDARGRTRQSWCWSPYPSSCSARAVHSWACS
jgi:hypothetical protein